VELTAFGNPLTLLTLGPIVAGLAFMLVSWAAPASKREEVSKSLRLLIFAFSLLLFSLSTLMFLESYSGISWTSIGINEYVYDNCVTSAVAIEAGGCALIDGFGVSWHVGVDGLSFPMVWLTTLLIPVSMLVEWDAKKGAQFHSLLLIMEGALIGVFVSLDLFVFYVFWELTLVPMFFLILLWGGEDRKYAAQKFFIYTFTASVLMLLGILILYYYTRVPVWEGNLTGRAFDLTLMVSSSRAQGLYLGGFGMQKAVFLLMLVGFAAKMPSVPVHTWLPDAHVQAPTAGSMVLAGVMLKMGAYGFIRLCFTLLPEATLHFQWLLVVLGMASLVYGAWVCMGQTNLKRLVAYSSVSHMGLVFLGIATMQPIGIAGAMFMMLAHGVISPHLFAVCGAFKHHYHTLEIGSMRGIAKFSPWMGGHMMTAWMGSLGLPMMAGFVAEVVIMIAFWLTFGWWVILPALTLIITAAYYLWSMQRTIFEGGDEGQLPDTLHDDPVDITWHENLGMFILAGLSVLLGVLPFLFFDMMSSYASTFVDGFVLELLGEVLP